MQLDHMSLEELKRLRKDVDSAIKSFEDRRFQEAREKVEAQAREMGFTLSQLVQPSGKRKAVNPPKYRHPENPQLTWTGKGRKPAWITQALENGESIDQYAV